MTASLLRSPTLFLVCALAGCTVGAYPRDGSAPIDAAPDAGPSHAVFFEEGLTEEVARLFETAPPSSVTAPEIVYPETGTLVPANITGVDIHFRSAVQQTFEVTFAQGGAASVVVYVGCAPLEGGCVLQPWPEVWDALAARRSAGPYEIRIRAQAGDAATAPSAPVTLELSSEEIHGGLYYRSLDDHPPAICRYDIGSGRRSSETFLDLPVFAFHASSLDGAAIAVTGLAGGDGTRLELRDVASREVRWAREFPLTGLLPRFGPSHDVLISSAGHGPSFPLMIVSGVDGHTLHELAVEGAHSADWSQDGDRIVFDITVPDGEIHPPYEIALVERIGGAWQSPRVLPTPGTLVETEPSFSPGATWIAYTALDEDDVDENGGHAPLLVAMRIADGRTVVLRRALANPDRYQEQPWTLRWSPSPALHRGRHIYWLTFASSRACGLLPREEGMRGSAVPGNPRQIWMAAFDPEADPDDPSRPAFRVPGQRWGYDDVGAEWSLEVRRQPCTRDLDCPGGELCAVGYCFPGGPE